MLLILSIEYKKCKTILSAPILYPLPWILSLFGLFLNSNFYPVSYGTLAIIIVGYILFCNGFHAISGPYGRSSFYETDYGRVIISHRSLNIVYYIALGICSYYLVVINRYVPFVSFSQIFLDILGNKASGVIEIPVYLSYLSGIVGCVRIFMLLLICTTDDITMGQGTRRRLKRRFGLLMALSIIILLTNFSRNAFLAFILPIIIVVCVCRKTSNKKMIRVGSISFALFVGVFAAFSMFRDSYLYEGENFVEIISDVFSLYLSGGIVAIDQCLKTGIIDIFSLNGFEHIFSAFTGIVDRLFGTNMTPDVVIQGIVIGKQALATNVYTVYHWVALDLGIVISIVFQFIYGGLYGHFFKGMVRGKLSSVYWYALLSYPLIMMFFEDQYTSIGQSWLVRIVSFWLVFKFCLKRD